MVVPFGFSVGDCIAVCLLIKDAVKALDSGHGASSEYRQVIRELWALDRALLEVGSISQGFETTVELNALSHAARRTETNSLESDQGCGSRWTDAKKKFGWAILRSDDLKTFRTEINGHASAINMLMITATVSLAKLNDKKLNERMDDQRRAQERRADDHLTEMRQVQNKIQEQTNILHVYADNVARLGDRMKYFFTLGTELKAFMARIWTVNFRSYNILVDLQTRVPREFGPCWIQEPIILTDALGRVSPVHLELVNSWNVLDAVLTARFRDIPGENKIKNNEYALQDRGSMMDIDRTRSFEASFLPGRNVDMSMIFKQRVPLGQICPGCRQRTEQKDLVAVTCVNCGLCFQRIEEIAQDLDCRPERSLDSSANRDKPVKIETNTSRIAQVPLSRKRAIEKDPDDDLKMFKRVRLLYTKDKVNTQIHVLHSLGSTGTLKKYRDYIGQALTLTIFLLPTATQPFPFEEETTAYRRCLSRGLYLNTLLQGLEHTSFESLVDSLFSHILRGRKWEPLQARICKSPHLYGIPMLRRLDSFFLNANTKSMEFIIDNCAVSYALDSTPAIYIALTNDMISWREMRTLRPSELGLEDAWSYDSLLDGPGEEYFKS